MSKIVFEKNTHIPKVLFYSGSVTFKICQNPDVFSGIQHHHAYLIYLASGFVINYLELLLLFMHMKKRIWIFFFNWNILCFSVRSEHYLFIGVALVIELWF